MNLFYKFFSSCIVHSIETRYPRRWNVLEASRTTPTNIYNCFVVLVFCYRRITVVNTVNSLYLDNSLTRLSPYFELSQSLYEHSWLFSRTRTRTFSMSIFFFGPLQSRERVYCICKIKLLLDYSVLEFTLSFLFRAMSLLMKK